MLPTTIHETPALNSFTSLAEHQSQTPSSFYSAKPVLHYHAAGVRAIIPPGQSGKLVIFENSSNENANTETSENGRVEAATVNVYVTSENLTLFNLNTSKGISVPYPSISLHAIQRLPDLMESSQEVQGLYMQLELSDPSSANDDDEPEVVEVTLIPPTTNPTQELFEAVSNCSNLHPDPVSQDEEMEDGNSERIRFEGNVGYEGISGLPGVQRGATDGGLPPSLNGRGWITSENLDEFFDEDGNWIGEELGQGAGRVRGRDEVNGHSGENGEEDDSKRSRTE